MGRFSIQFAVCFAVAAVGLAMTAQRYASAETSDHRDRRDGWPVYQRRAFDWTDNRGHSPHGGHHGYAPQWAAPQVSSGWFQRPYPYHLDYYKMRYGGSYAPYFGNLYGPPQVVTAPPYYGPYYGGYEYGYPNAYGPNGAYPGLSNGAMHEGPIEDNAASPSVGDNLPSP